MLTKEVEVEDEQQPLQQNQKTQQKVKEEEEKSSDEYFYDLKAWTEDEVRDSSSTYKHIVWILAWYIHQQYIISYITVYVYLIQPFILLFHLPSFSTHHEYIETRVNQNCLLRYSTWR